MPADPAIWIQALFVTLLGLAFGSFTNTVIYRVPRFQSVVAPRSRCPHCGIEIQLRDNVPIISFLALKGRCRTCQWRIPLQYPFVELFTATLFLASYATFGPSIRLIPVSAFVCVVVALSVIDLHHRLLPDVITYPAFVLSFFAAAMGWALEAETVPPTDPAHPMIWTATLIGLSGLVLWVIDWIDIQLVAKRLECDAEESPEEPARAWLTPATVGLSALCAALYLIWAGLLASGREPGAHWADLERVKGAYLGATVAGGIIWAMRIIYFLVRREEGTGFGDVKMMMFVGGFLGWRFGFSTILLASVLGSVAGLAAIIKSRDRSIKIPFGIFLGAGALISLFLGAQLLGWYFSRWAE